MVAPAELEATFLYGREGPTGRIAARLRQSEVRENGVNPACAGTHAGHTESEPA
jgi:hypothetical protein